MFAQVIGCRAGMDNDFVHGQRRLAWREKGIGAEEQVKVCPVFL